MQTFLPYASFAQSAAVLDRTRLGNQRSENIIMFRALLLPDRGYASHAVTRMWSDHIPAFLDYHRHITYEWTANRGYKDTCWEKIRSLVEEQAPEEYEDYLSGDFDFPWFVGREDVHLAHQSNLIRKKPEFYIPVFGDVPDDLEYIYTDPDDV